ncbi:hypothetical protein [Paraburkholderia sp. A3RO-2L]|uniref:hypothetical protein n=1 Tax=unclassified Paraburkholderia TaxID=2615204 RepID=UPI0032F2A79A|nr:hypothetical protein [Burkholderia vietnamiensis]
MTSDGIGVDVETNGVGVAEPRPSRSFVLPASWEALMRRGRKMNSAPRRPPTPAPWYRKFAG